MSDMKFETEIRGMTPEYVQAYEEQLTLLRAGIALDHDLIKIKRDDQLGPQADAAFEAFRLWYAGQR